MQRRGFLAGIFAAGVAPAFVGSGVLMPVRALILPDLYPRAADCLTLEKLLRARSVLDAAERDCNPVWHTTEFMQQYAQNVTLLLRQKGERHAPVARVILLGRI